MKINKNNMFMITGELIKDPIINKNKDGSKSVKLCIKPNDYDFDITLTGLISKNIKSLGPYEYIKKNQTLQILYSLRCKEINNQTMITPQIDYIQFSSVIGTDKDIIQKVLLENIKETAKENNQSYSVKFNNTEELMQLLYQDAF